MSITLTCQLELLMLVEKICGWGAGKLIMVNTDGAEFLVKREGIEFFYGLCADWEIETNNIEYGRLEYVEYDFIAQLSVNDYIAKYTNGDVKRKGSFLTYEDIKNGNWHKDSSAMIIPHALEQFFLNSISPEETINNCNNIFDFCYGAKRQKAVKKGSFKWLISETTETGLVVNHLNSDRFMRYYIGGNMTINKLYEDGDIKNLPTKGQTSTTAQYLRREEIIKKDNNAYENLNKQFYIDECNDVINQILNKNNE